MDVRTKIKFHPRPDKSENVVRTMTAIVSRPEWVKPSAESKLNGVIRRHQMETFSVLLVFCV